MNESPSYQTRNSQSIMPSIMLCGAGDTAEVLPSFIETVDPMGFEPWSFLDGTIRYRNSKSTGWKDNSRGSVREADIVVFVILEKYGKIAWTEEFPTVIEAGVPFLIFCLDETLAAYRNRHIAGTSQTKPDQSDLFATLETLEHNHQLTIVPFGRRFFSVMFRQHLAMLLEQAATALRQENIRALERSLILGEGDLTPVQIESVRRIVRDEMEDKNLRKRGMDALWRHSAFTSAEITELAGSAEQGVARKMIAMLANLGDFLTEDSLKEIVVTVNDSDDVGMRRRLVTALGGLPPRWILNAVAELQISEIGTARRVLHMIEHHIPSALDEAQRRKLHDVILNCRDYKSKSSVGEIKDLADHLLNHFNLKEFTCG